MEKAFQTYDYKHKPVVTINEHVEDCFAVKNSKNNLGIAYNTLKLKQVLCDKDGVELSDFEKFESQHDFLYYEMKCLNPHCPHKKLVSATLIALID